LIAREWGIPLVLVLNKADLPARIGDLPAGRWEAISISAEQGEGIDRLRSLIVEILLDGKIPARNTILLLDTWERDLLRRLGASLSRGIDVNESILDRVFSRFCVGK